MESITQSDNLKEFLKLALIRCMEILKSESGSIFLLDDNGEELVLKIALNADKRFLEGIRQKLGEGISGLVASQREPLLVEDIRKDSRFQNRQGFNHYRTNSFLSVPLTSDGKVIGVINITERLSGEPFSPDDLKLILNICNYLDIAMSSLERYEEFKKLEVEDLKKQIEASGKLSSLGRFAAGLIHELNNPLDGIIRYTNLCLDCLGEETIVREYLLEAKKGLNRIAKIIRSLLDFVQSSSPAFNRPVDINNSIEDSIFMMSHEIFSNKIEVVKQFTHGLPTVRDKGLRLIFTNLIRNACDAIGPRGGKIKISTGMENGSIEIKFTDTGPGIPEELKDKIFEPFFTTKEMGKGSGLGLAICYDIIQRYKGKIFVESKKGEGATLTVELPLNGSGVKRYGGQ